MEKLLVRNHRIRKEPGDRKVGIDCSALERKKEKEKNFLGGNLRKLCLSIIEMSKLLKFMSKAILK